MVWLRSRGRRKTFDRAILEQKYRYRESTRIPISSTMNTTEFNALDRRYKTNWANEIKYLTQNRLVTRYNVNTWIPDTVVLTNHAQKVQILQDKKTNADYAWRTAYNRIVFARGNNLRTEDVLMLDLINDRLKTLNKIQEAINNLWSVARR
jgi:hypothetical protein